MNILGTTVQPGLASPPASPAVGQTYYDTALAAVRVYTAYGWVTLRPPTSRVNHLRPTTESLQPVSPADRTGQSSIYTTPCGWLENTVSLYNGTIWLDYSVPEIVAPVLSGLTSGKNYDDFYFAGSAAPSGTDTSTDVLTFGTATGWHTGAAVTADATGGGLTAGTFRDGGSGAVYFYRAVTATTGTLHATLANAVSGTSPVNLTANITATLTAVGVERSSARTDDVTRADAVGLLDDVWVKTGANTRRLGYTFRTTGAGTTEDSKKNRFLSPVGNRELRPVQYLDVSGGTHPYASSTIRQYNADASAAVFWVESRPTGGPGVDVSASYIQTNTAAGALVGVGIDSATVNSAPQTQVFGSSSSGVPPTRLACTVGTGYHSAALLEQSTNAANIINISVGYLSGTLPC